MELKRARAKKRAIKILQKSLAKNPDVECAIETLRKKKVTPSDAATALSEVLDVPLSEADHLLMNSRAFQEMKQATLEIREAFIDAFEKDSDYAYDAPHGNRVIHIDLGKNTEGKVRNGFKHRLRKRLRYLLVIIVLYVSSYYLLSCFGSYVPAPSGNFRYDSGLAVTDALFWHPKFLYWHTSRNILGKNTSGGNFLGFLYSPLVYIDHRFVHKPIALLPPSRGQEQTM